MANQDKNLKNPQSPLFRKLTRLFSGPIVNHRTQAIRQYRRKQLDKFSNNFQSASGKQFKKAVYNPFMDLHSDIMANHNRTHRYIDFDQMEYEPIIASALDIYADEMTTSSYLQPLLKINTVNEEIKIVLEALYTNVMNIEHNLFGWCRTMCKYGDMFLYIELDEEEGVQNLIGLPTKELERLEGEDKTNPNYVQYQWNTAGLTLENWQIAHFRVLGNDKYAPYGTSVLEPARRIWRQLTLLEDSMMAYRIVRSPERRVFKIDVGNIPPEEVEQYMQKVVTQMKRNQVVDADTGRVDLRYNPLSIDEDYFIPIRAGSGTEITSLPGGTYTGDIDDVKYLKDKLFAALKVPQAYLFRGEGAEEDKTTLAQKDVRFARTIQRLQRVIVAELEKIGIIHLFTLGYRGADLVSFKLSLNNPSKIAELQELEHWGSKFDTAGAAAEGFFSKRWIASNVFNISDDEFLRNQREMYYDRIFEAELEAVATAAGESAATESASAEEGMGGELGGEEEMDLGGDEELGGELGGEDLGGEELGGEEMGGEEEGTLLAAPGKRDEEDWYKLKKRDQGKIKTTTSDSKDKWYEPKKHRGGDRRNAGARLRSNKAKYADEKGRAVKRNLFPGLSGLSSLSSGIYEQKDTNYEEQEEKLFKANADVKRLITELELKNKDDEVKT
jgi:hypothetical protein